MKRVTFEDIDENGLFWWAESGAPKSPQEFFGPYKKKIYMEFYRDAPKHTFVRGKTPTLSDVIITRRAGRFRNARDH